MSLLVYVGGIGTAVFLGSFKFAATTGDKKDQQLEGNKKGSSYPSKSVQLFSIIASLGSVLFTFYHLIDKFVKQRGNADWPPYFGLFCGLGAVAIAQVVLMGYISLHRYFHVIGDGKKIQLRQVVYERDFLADMIHHFSNPGAFILLLPYLCLTWMFRLMPESYYNYDAPINWMNVLLQLLVVDFFTYVFHIGEHCVPTWYKFGHKPHHRFVNPHMLNAFDGSLADTTALILFPLYSTAQLIHASNWDYVAFGTIYSTHFMLIHSDVSHIFDPLLKMFYVNIAEDHHVHHALFNYNFGHFFTIYDRIGGTYRAGSDCKGFSDFKGTTKTR